MKLACDSVGNTIGWGGTTPLHAICNVVQVALPGLARRMSLVMSPTTLISVFTGGPPCIPALRVRRRSPRCLDKHDRMVRVERSQVPVHRHAARGRHVTVRWL